MRVYEVAFEPGAEQDLAEILAHVTAASGRTVATGFLDGILAYCEGLSAAPMRGASHDDILPGLRTVGWRRTVTIAFQVDETHRRVFILGVYYRGRDVLAALRQLP